MASDRSTLLALIASLIDSNGSGGVTALDERTVLNEIIDSITIFLDDPFLRIVSTTSGTQPDYVVTLTDQYPDDYSNVIPIMFKAHATSTGAATFKVNSLTAKNLRRPDGSATEAGDIVQDRWYMVNYVSGDDEFVIFPGFGGAVTIPGGGTTTVENGGTGRTSHTAYALIAGGTTSTGAQQSISGVGTSGQVLKSNGAGSLPSWQNESTGGVDTSGTPVANDYARFTDADTIEGRSVSEVFTDLGLAAGTYSPTITNTANISSTSVREIHYQRLGSIVFVSGAINGTHASSGGTTTTIRLSLPVSSSFDATTRASGQVWVDDNTAAAPHVLAFVSTNTLELEYNYTGTTGAGVIIRFMASYRII